MVFRPRVMDSFNFLLQKIRLQTNGRLAYVVGVNFSFAIV